MIRPPKENRVINRIERGRQIQDNQNRGFLVFDTFEKTFLTYSINVGDRLADRWLVRVQFDLIKGVASLALC